MDPTLEPFVTDELKSDPVAWPIVEKMPEKSVADVLKGYAHSQHRLGSAVPLLNGDAKPEDIAKWKEQHLPRLQKAGLVDIPRKLPDKYEITKPEGLPEGVWNENLEKEALAFAKTHGLSQEALADAVKLHFKSFEEFGKAVEVNRKAQAEQIAKWAAEEGTTVEEVDAALDRFNKDPRGWDIETAELVSKAGYADNPLVVKAIYKLIKESGIMDTRNDQGALDNAIGAEESEVLSIMTILNDPKHVEHAKFNTSENQAKIDAYWKKKAGGAQYVIS